VRGVCRHDEVLKYLKDFHLYHMRMPTAKETQYDLKISHGALCRILQSLARKGKLKKVPMYVLPYKVI
jgi:hypothetical protein